MYCDGIYGSGDKICYGLNLQLFGDLRGLSRPVQKCLDHYFFICNFGTGGKEMETSIL